MSDSILPPGSSDFEKSIEGAAARRLDELPVTIAEAARPLKAPEGFAPFIAWGRGGGSVWNDAWPDAVQRSNAEAQYRLARQRGTLAGIEGQLAFLPHARLVRAILPPQGVFAAAGGAEGDAVWRAWRDGLDEIRVFPRRDGGIEHNHLAGDDEETVTAGQFLGAEDGAATFFMGGGFPDPYQAVLIEGGVERSIEVRVAKDPRRGRAGDVFELTWDDEAGAGAFFDDLSSVTGFAGGAPEAENFRQVSLGFGLDLDEGLNVLAATRAVQDVTPEIGWSDAAAISGVYARDVWTGRFFAADGDDDHRFWSWRLISSFDDRRPPAAFFGDARFGLPPYTAELVIESRGECGLDEAYSGFFAGAAFTARPHGRSDLSIICDAVEAGMALRDTVLIDFDAAPRLRASASFDAFFR